MQRMSGNKCSKVLDHWPAARNGERPTSRGLTIRQPVRQPVVVILGPVCMGCNAFVPPINVQDGFLRHLRVETKGQALDARPYSFRPDSPVQPRHRRVTQFSQ